MSYFLDTSKFAQGEELSSGEDLSSSSIGENILVGDNVDDVDDVSNGVRNAFRKYDVIIFNSTEGYDAVANDVDHDFDRDGVDVDTGDDPDDGVEEITEVSIKGTVLPYTGVKDGEIVTINSDDSPTGWTITNQRGPKAIKINNLIGDNSDIQFRKNCDNGERFNSVVDMMTYVLKDFLAKNNCEFGETFSFDLEKYGVGGLDDGWYGSSQLVHSLERWQFIDGLVKMLKLNLNDAFYSSGKGRLWDVFIDGNTLILEHLEPTDKDFSMVNGVNKIINSEAMRMLRAVDVLDEANKRGASFEILKRPVVEKLS